MIRTAKSLAVVLAVTAAVAVLPGAAGAADRHHDGPLVVFGDNNQFAGGDVFNAGRDNIVGSFEGANAMPGVGLPGAGDVRLAIVNYGTAPDYLTLASHTGTADFPEHILYASVGYIQPGPGVSEAVYSGYRIPVRIRTDGSNLECLVGCNVSYDRGLNQLTATIR